MVRIRDKDNLNPDFAGYAKRVFAARGGELSDGADAPAPEVLTAPAEPATLEP
jgi:hypothetical protein